jgi:crossover junction endodeoxyribonuclease RusA
LISEKGRDYRKEVAESLAGSSTITGPVKVEVECWMPDRRKRDLDNLFKAIGDSLTHAGVWEDDSQVDDLRIYRAREQGNLLIGGMVKVRIEPLGQGTKDLAA